MTNQKLVRALMFCKDTIQLENAIQWIARLNKLGHFTGDEYDILLEVSIARNIQLKYMVGIK